LPLGVGEGPQPQTKIHTGVIVGDAVGRGVRIILDGSKTPITLHKSYVEPLTPVPAKSR